MRFADFHSDILTDKNFSGLPDNYGGDLTVVTAIFRGNARLSDVVSLADKSDIVAFEDVGYEDFSLDAISSTNPAYVGITWNGENRFGYGCNYTFGLKEEGKSLIKSLNACGIPVDAAHISKGGFYDIIDLADSVVDSHTCFSGAFSHKRNIDDEQIGLIIEREGIIGVTMCGYFMTDGKVCKISDFISQIDYFSQKFGVDNLAVGTDFFGTDFLPCTNGDYAFFDEAAYSLYGMGYTDSDVDKIFYKNLSGFLEKRYGRTNQL